MQIVPSEWRLSGQRCPCFCGGEGFLVFITCPSCASVVLVCDEVGTVFTNPKNLQEKSWLSWLELDRCPRCTLALLSTFEYATSDQIRACGFTNSEFA